MISFLCKGAAHLPIDWTEQQSPHANITVGKWGGVRWAWEEFYGPWDVLHVPSLELLEALLDEVTTGNVELHGMESAAEEIKPYPKVTILDENEQPIEVDKPTPGISGGVTPGLVNKPKNEKAWKKQPGKAIEKVKKNVEVPAQARRL